MQPLLLPVTLRTLANAAIMAVGFIAIIFAGSILLPGIERHGYPLANGETKAYKLTGMTLFFFLNLVIGIARFGFGVSLAPIVQHFWSLLIVAAWVAITWSVALFLYAGRRGLESGATPLLATDPSPS